MQLTTIWPIVAGPFVGSFAAVLVRRLPAGRPIAMARSACEACGRPLAPWDMIPLVSFVVLRGRCRACHAPIAAEHLAIEVAAMALAALAVLGGARGGQLWANCILAWTLLPLAIIDWQHFRLPDCLTLPLLLAGLAATAWLDQPSLTGNALAAAIGYASFRLLALVYRKLRGRSGLGQGDAKLIAAIGAWEGLTGQSNTLLAAAVAGLIFGGGRIALGRARPADAIPFGPFLALGAIVSEIFLGSN